MRECHESVKVLQDIMWQLILFSLPEIMKNKHNRRPLSQVLTSFDMESNVLVECKDDTSFNHEETDVTMIVAECSKVIKRLILMSSVYWV